MLLIIFLVVGLGLCHLIGRKLLPKSKSQAMAEVAWSNLLDLNLDEDKWDGWVVHRYTNEEYKQVRADAQ
jgi:hypothetical protein